MGIAAPPEGRHHPAAASDRSFETFWMSTPEDQQPTWQITLLRQEPVESTSSGAKPGSRGRAGFSGRMMKRGDLYRIRRPGAGDPKKSRVFVVVSRQTSIESRFSTVICARVYTHREGLATEVLATEVNVGIADGRAQT